MVSILQALKITAFYCIFLIPSMAAMIVSVFLANPRQEGGVIVFDNAPIPFFGLIGIFVGAALIFLIFLFKGIGDITEAALIE